MLDGSWRAKSYFATSCMLILRLCLCCLRRTQMIRVEDDRVTIEGGKVS